MTPTGRMPRHLDWQIRVWNAIYISTYVLADNNKIGCRIPTFALISFKDLRIIGSSATDASVTVTLSVGSNVADLFVSSMVLFRSLMTVHVLSERGIVSERLPSKFSIFESRSARFLLIVSRSERTVAASRLKRGALKETPIMRLATMAWNS